MFSLGISKYFGFNKKSDIICIGHSHTVLGIDAALLEQELNKTASKYALAGANAMDRYWMVKHYLEINPDVKIVLYDVDNRLFDSEGLSSASYSLFLPFIDNQMMKIYLKEQASYEEYLVSTFIKTARFRDQTLNISLRGLLNKNESKKLTQVNIDNYKTYLESERSKKVNIDDDSVDYLKKTIEYVLAKGKKIVLVNIPVIDILNEIDEENQIKAHMIFQEMALTKDVFFFDYENDYADKHEIFFDLRHLNEKGKQLLTLRLAKDLKNINE